MRMLQMDMCMMNMCMMQWRMERDCRFSVSQRGGQVG